jgi:hypothetical protein
MQTLAALLLADGVPCLLLDDLTPRLGEDACAPDARLRYLVLLPVPPITAAELSRA